MEESEGKRIFVKRSEGFSSAREDLISKLHDSLISKILLYLPIKVAVRTSVLSKRWETVWPLIQELDLESDEFPSHNAFVVFRDKLLDFSKGENLCLNKLKLNITNNKNDQSCVTRLIDFVATRKLKHLDVEYLCVERKCLEVMPLSLYIKSDTSLLETSSSTVG